MFLQIVSIHNHGNYAEEYVRLKAVEDCELDDYLLIDTSYNGDGVVSNKLRHTYWWAPKTFARKGDIVFLYTRSGGDNVRDDADGRPRLRDFFWNLKHPVWNDTGDIATLFNIKTFLQKQARPA